MPGHCRRLVSSRRPSFDGGQLAPPGSPLRVAWPLILPPVPPGTGVAVLWSGVRLMKVVLEVPEPRLGVLVGRSVVLDGGPIFCPRSWFPQGVPSPASVVVPSRRPWNPQSGPGAPAPVFVPGFWEVFFSGAVLLVLATVSLALVWSSAAVLFLRGGLFIHSSRPRLTLARRPLFVQPLLAARGDVGQGPQASVFLPVLGLKQRRPPTMFSDPP